MTRRCYVPHSVPDVQNAKLGGLDPLGQLQGARFAHATVVQYQFLEWACSWSKQRANLRDPNVT